MLCLGDSIRRVDFFFISMQVLIENSHAFLTYPINYFSLTVIEHHDQKHIKQVFFFLRFQRNRVHYDGKKHGNSH